MVYIVLPCGSCCRTRTLMYAQWNVCVLWLQILILFLIGLTTGAI